jgi:hypothetical protein
VKSIRTSRAVGCLLATIALGQAQSVPVRASKSDWGNLRALTDGMEIRVIKTNSKAIDGTFRSVNNEGLTVGGRAGEEMIGRGSVLAVSRKERSRRRRNVLIGVGVGAALGLTTGVATDSLCPTTGYGAITCPGGGAGKKLFTPLGAFVGSVVGAAIPTGWREMYRMR